MHAAMQSITMSRKNPAEAYQFLQTNLGNLNESLLVALPLIFNKLIANKPPQTRKKISELFAVFGLWVQQFPLGNRMLNLELAIVCCKLALKILTRDDFPTDWAAIQNSLGLAYSERIQGERTENLEQAIVTYEFAMQIYTQESFPEHWAMLQNNLGVAYEYRIQGNRAENLELAIAYHTSALQVHSRDIFPEDWAMTHNNLGNAYRERIRGDLAENLEQAIEHYKLTLQVRTREAFPVDWATAQQNMGITYRKRIRGEQANNIEQALSCHHSALEILTYEAYPERWASVQNNLGNAYGDRIKGDRANNIEQSIAAFNMALKVYTQETFPEKWAMMQVNLGSAYINRMQGESASNIEQALEHCHLALKVYTQKSFPERWAMCQVNLGLILIEKSTLNKNITELDKAITLLRTSLEVFVVGDSLSIDSRYLLGNALSLRYEYSQNPSDLEQSLQEYKIALNTINPEHYRIHSIWRSLPETQAVLGSRMVRDGKWQEGLQLLINSVTKLSTNDDSLAYASALFQTGSAHETLSDLPNARLYYRDALRLYEYLQDLPGIAKSKAGLGSVLVSQGHLENGMKELASARESYRQLQQTEQAAEIDSLYQSAQRVMERQSTEIYA